MTRFESSVKSIPYPASRIYGMLSDFDNFESLLPSDKVKNWESQGDSCRFEVEGIGPVGLKIIDREEPKTIKFTADGKVPFNFFLWIQLKEVEDEDTKLKLTLDAELNPMIKMVAQKPLKKFLGLLADAIADHHY
ncbi:SRPBCC family protein [Marinilabilia rubra]|uniref:SRPBCC family protein n=1 Tax=Marinilabilia rubra TaxID=2162893 RepID=A0A2U2BDL8_9BACT|nr:SRPBCC family protein [Marinilabilia rubra]PWE01162.1 SRPBCC family protein [Marinilabilia rubra]